jgi:hypothetical protein
MKRARLGGPHFKYDGMEANKVRRMKDLEEETAYGNKKSPAII